MAHEEEESPLANRIGRDPKPHPKLPAVTKHHGHHERNKQRHDKMPPGFIRYRGKGCPFPPDARVEIVIRTASGFGIDGPIKAKMHDWTLPASELGSIAGYRLVVATP
jgi:hypothetical protein